jgi:hypothetical protein
MDLAEPRLRDDLRRVLTGAIEDNPDARRLISDGLGVEPYAVEAMLTAPDWQLGLSLRLADLLGVRFHVGSVRKDGRVPVGGEVGKPVFCPFTDDGKCPGDCPSNRDRSCIDGPGEEDR